MQRSLLAGILVVWSTVTLADIEVSAWSRATPPGGSSAAIYGSFTNNGSEAVTLETVEVEFARHVMVHKTQHVDGMARMQHASLVIPANETVEMKPDGLHIMLMGLIERLQIGCRYPVQLTWSNGSVTRHEFLTGSFGQLTAPDPDALEECE